MRKTANVIAYRQPLPSSQALSRDSNLSWQKSGQHCGCAWQTWCAETNSCGWWRGYTTGTSPGLDDLSPVLATALSETNSYRSVLCKVTVSYNFVTRASAIAEGPQIAAHYTVGYVNELSAVGQYKMHRFDIFAFTMYCDTETSARSHSRSCKWRHSIVSMALSCTVFDIFDSTKYCDLVIWVGGHTKLSKLVTIQQSAYEFLLMPYSNSSL